MAALAVIAAAAVLAAVAPRQDDLALAQARVEALYAAGSLPEALAAAREALRSHGDDPILLRRACQLALSLRAPALAREPAERLRSLVKEGAREGTRFPVDALPAWRAEAETFVREVEDLEAREREVEGATVRARTVAVSALVVLGLGLFVLGKGNRPPPEAGSGR